jgi:hypothetical protein
VIDKLPVLHDPSRVGLAGRVNIAGDGCWHQSSATIQHITNQIFLSQSISQRMTISCKYFITWEVHRHF